MRQRGAVFSGIAQPHQLATGYLYRIVERRPQPRSVIQPSPTLARIKNLFPPVMLFLFPKINHQGRTAMLAEKFFLVLETIKSHSSDEGVRIVSSTPQVPAKLPTKK